MDEKLMDELKAVDESMDMNKVEFKGDEVNALFETVGDFLAICKHTYKVQLHSMSQLEQMFKDAKDSEETNSLAAELERTKTDMIAIDKAIGRNIGFILKIADVLGFDLDDEGNPKEPATDGDDGAADNEQQAEVSEDA